MSAPIAIASKRSSTSGSSSLSSSPSSSSSSSSGVYVPVHRRTPSVPRTPQRTLPIYTPAELTALAQSPLVKQFAAATHAALHQHAHEEDDVFAEITLSRRQQRTREYMARKEEAEARHHHQQQQQLKAVVAPPTPTNHRRPAARVTPAQQRWNASTNKFVDAASWRPAVVRHAEVLPVSLAI